MSIATEAALTIGDLAREAGVPVSTVRYYERIGILQPRSRTESGYRQYGDAELERLKFLKLAQGLGFTLEDAALLLDLREKAPVAKEQVDAMVRARLDKVNEHLAQLLEIKCVMEAALRCCVENCDCPKCHDLVVLQEKILGDFRKSA